MEESCDPVIKIVYMPFFEVEITRGVRLGGELVKSHIYFVYTEFCHITYFFFFYPRRNMQDFCQYETLPPHTFIFRLFNFL